MHTHRMKQKAAVESINRGILAEKAANMSNTRPTRMPITVDTENDELGDGDDSEKDMLSVDVVKAAASAGEGSDSDSDSGSEDSEGEGERRKSTIR